MKFPSKHQNILHETKQLMKDAQAGKLTDTEVDQRLDAILEKADKQGFTALRMMLNLAGIHGSKEKLD